MDRPTKAQHHLRARDHRFTRKRNKTTTGAKQRLGGMTNDLDDLTQGRTSVVDVELEACQSVTNAVVELDGTLPVCRPIVDLGPISLRP